MMAENLSKCNMTALKYTLAYFPIKWKYQKPLARVWVFYWVCLYELSQIVKQSFAKASFSFSSPSTMFSFFGEASFANIFFVAHKLTKKG